MAVKEAQGRIGPEPGTHEAAQPEREMEINLDREISRKGTNCVKWEFRQAEGDMLEWEHTEQCLGENRILPLWVADMDFASPAPVVEALVERAKHGIYGYSAPTRSFFESIVNWTRRRHSWEIEPEWICLTPGVVPALNMLVQTFVALGEKVLSSRRSTIPSTAQSKTIKLNLWPTCCGLKTVATGWILSSWNGRPPTLS